MKKQIPKSVHKNERLNVIKPSRNKFGFFILKALHKTITRNTFHQITI